jgi:hypothetical protein
MENNKNNTFLLENINKFKNLEELKDFQKLMNEACDNKAVELNVKNEAKNLEFPSYLYIKESFENMADKLFTTAKGRKLIGRYVKEHKTNKDLNKMFHIYENLNKADKTINVINMIQEMKNMVGDINEFKLQKGIDNLKKIIRESYVLIGVQAKSLLSENKHADLPNYVDYVFTNALKMDNMVKYNKCINEIKSFVDSNAISEVSFKTATKVDIDECYARYNELLADENDVVKEIRESVNKEEVFEKYKNSCLAAIESTMSTNINQATCDKLYEFKTRILNKNYNEETLGEDISNFIELENTVKE